MAENATLQQSKSVSLVDALMTLDRVEPVEAHDRDLHAAVGATLATDAKTDTTLRLTGARLRRVDIVLLALHGIDRVTVRSPRLLVTHSGDHSPVSALIAGAIESEGGTATIEVSKTPLPTWANPDIDAVITICDDGGDRNLQTLASKGTLIFDRVALSPGGAIAFGYFENRPVLLFPEPIEQALAAWLTLGRRQLARLSFRLIEEQPFYLELARPIFSTRGIAEVIPVRRRAAQVEPLTGDIWSANAIARADGWILVPADSDGFPAGTRVQMRPWP